MTWGPETTAEVKVRAVEAMERFARPETGYRNWFEDLHPYLSGSYAEEAEYVDPANIPVSDIKSGPELNRQSSNPLTVTAVFETNDGPWSVVLHRSGQNEPWLVAAIEPRGAGPMKKAMMGVDKALVQPEPVISAIINADNTGVLSVNSWDEKFTGEDAAQLRQDMMARIFEVAAECGRPVRVSTMDEDGLITLLVSASGDVEQEADEPVSAADGGQKQAPADHPAGEPVAPMGRRALRESGSFLVSTPVVDPATQGWRGFLARWGFRVAPSDEELAEREDVRLVSQHWPGPRKIAVVNRKGGANKTPTVAMLSAVLARYSGAATAAWDNNESQGTLGWRTEQGGHANSVLDLVDSSVMLLAPGTNAAEIARFVHHQTSDKYDVLRSDENDEGDHEVTAEEVDIAHQVLTRYYRLIVMDSGNTARSANWRQMIHHTDQLVVPVTAAEDRAEAARKTLQTLESRGGHDADLARNAVVIVSESTDAKHGMSGEALKRSRAEAQRIADAFSPYVRAVARIPYDPALVNGSLRYDALRPETRRAWLAAAAEVARGL